VGDYLVARPSSGAKLLTPIAETIMSGVSDGRGD
jgi:hypothetical protein